MLSPEMIESAGIVLVRSDPRDVVGAIELSRATYRKMIQKFGLGDGV
jgi:cation transport ATPase